MLAFISDLHSNMEAINTVCDHIAAQGVDKTYCLGDVIGYGPEPREALKRVPQWEACLRGNHEEAVLYFAEDFNEKARVALDWTRDQLNDPAVSREERFELWRILSDEMKLEHRFDNFLLVHGSPRDPIREYMLPRDVQNAEKMRGVFDKMDRQICFVGHSHVPGVYPESGGFIPPSECADGYRIKPNEKALVNVGSVGQPRDGDNRASYVTCDGETIFFHRLEYDYESTIRKILATNVLPEYLAGRLKAGR